MNLLMELKPLGLVLTTRCNFLCAHCCNSCTSQGLDLTLDEGKNAIDEYAELGGRILTYTGGEVTLVMDNLIELISYSTCKGLEASITTNGFWYRNADSYISRFKAAGAAGFLISCDIYHLQFIPWLEIRHIVDLCKDIDYPVRLLWNSIYFSTSTKRDLTIREMKDALEEIKPYIPLEDIKKYFAIKDGVDLGPIEKLGRASNFPFTNFSCHEINNWTDSLELVVRPGYTFSLNCCYGLPHSTYHYEPGHFIPTVRAIVKSKQERGLTPGYVLSCVECSAIKNKERENERSIICSIS